MKKRILSILLTLCMIFALLPATAAAANVLISGKCGANATWVITDDGVMTISGTGTVTAPTDEEDAALKMASVRVLNIEEGITAIDYGAFRSCTSLEKAAVAGSVKTIRDGAFWGCTSLQSVVLLDGVQLLEGAVFYNCTSLEEIYLPDTIIGQISGTFENCSSLQTVRVPANVSWIGSYTFANCTALEYIILPGSVTSIDPYAFSNTPQLTELYYAGTEEMLYSMAVHPSGNTQLESVEIYLIPSMPDPVFGLFDMPAQDNWAYDGIAFCLYSGLMNGMGGGYFQPNGTTTRAQLVTILWRMMDAPKSTKAAPFTDLTQDWYRDAVAWAAENGITTGTSAKTFSPDTPVTREQMVTIFYRMYKDYLKLDVSPAAALSAFPDNSSVSSWAKNALQWGVAVKLINGVADDKGSVFLQPQGNATRAQIATVMLNFVTAFADDLDA